MIVLWKSIELPLIKEQYFLPTGIHRHSYCDYFGSYRRAGSGFGAYPWGYTAYGTTDDIEYYLQIRIEKVGM